METAAIVVKLDLGDISYLTLQRTIPVARRPPEDRMSPNAAPQLLRHALPCFRSVEEPYNTVSRPSSSSISLLEVELDLGDV